MALLDFLFGKAPKVQTKQLFSPQDVGATFEQLLPLMREQLLGLGQQTLGGAAAFGPGFQGTIPGAVASAQNQSLLQLLNLAAQITAGSRENVVTPGSSGIVPALLGGIAGGAGMGLGAGLLGGGGGGLVSLAGLAGQNASQDFDALNAQQRYKNFTF